MSVFEDVMGTLLMYIIPIPVLWALGLIAVLVGGLVLMKTPGSSAAFFFFIIIWQLAYKMGGIFQVFNMLMLLFLAIVLVSAVAKIGNR